MLQVVATDLDLGANGSVRYMARARGPARGLLRVHAATGRLYASPRLPLTPDHAYDVTVSPITFHNFITELILPQMITLMST